MYNVYVFLEAAYRFYKSKCEAQSLERSGKSGSRRIARRRYERISRVSKLV